MMGAQGFPQGGDGAITGDGLLAGRYDGGTSDEGVASVASRDQIRALLAVSCPWCHAAVNEPCSTMGHRRDGAEGPRRSDRRPIRTLDGGSHDARWRRALGEPAPVRREVVAEEHQVHRERQLIGAPVERPW